MKRKKLSLKRIRSRAIVYITAVLAGFTGSQALGGDHVPVDLELVLAVDTSASVDNGEYRLQMEGLARAFQDPEIITAIRSTGPQGIAVTLAHWSSAHQQAQVVPWTVISDAASARAFAAAILRNGLRRYSHSTGIGGALSFGERLIRRNGFEGRRKTIDVSGDGANNSGAVPSYIRERVLAEGITINGLAILNEDPFLDLYYAGQVIGGPGAFMMTASGYHSFSEAMKNKLLREISTPMVKLEPIAPAARPVKFN